MCCACHLVTHLAAAVEVPPGRHRLLRQLRCQCRRPWAAAIAGFISTALPIFEWNFFAAQQGSCRHAGLVSSGKGAGSHGRSGPHLTNGGKRSICAADAVPQGPLELCRFRIASYTVIASVSMTARSKLEVRCLDHTIDRLAIANFTAGS